MSDQTLVTASIVEVARDYYNGMCSADEVLLKRAFHPNACIIGYYQGSLAWNSRDDFIDFCKSMADEATLDEVRIEATDIVGDTAMVTVVDRYLGEWYTDYLTLLKIDGRWQIVNKTFQLHTTS
jgi:hypothetical protein